MSLTAEAALRKDQANALRPTLQSRHMAQVAGIISRMDDPQLKRSCALHFAGELSSIHPQFNITRFLAGCDVKP